MKHPLSVTDQEIITAILNGYGITLLAIEFLPFGEGSWTYEGRDMQRRRWFIKLSRRDTRYIDSVTTYLHDEVGLSFVCSPVRTRTGGPAPALGKLTVNLYPFIVGETLSYDSLDDETLRRIGDCLRRLHQTALPEQLTANIPHETFDQYQSSAKTYIARARAYSGSDPELLTLQRYIASYEPVISQTLSNAKSISQYCQLRTYRRAVCHADIHPFNIIKSKSDLSFIDWDGITLAPPEDDTRFYGAYLRSDTSFRRAYDPEYRPDESLLTYYAYEWVLQEYTDYIGRLFDVSLALDARRHACAEFRRLFGTGETLGGVVGDALASPLPR